MIYNVVLVSGYSKMNQLYIYVYPFFFRFFPHIGYYRILSRDHIHTTVCKIDN